MNIRQYAEEKYRSQVCMSKNYAVFVEGSLKSGIIFHDRRLQPQERLP